jgi:hypothetical protein
LSNLAQIWQWAYSLHNVGAIQSVITDEDNVIVATSFTGSCQIQNTVINGNGNNFNIVLAGFSSSGMLLWKKVISTPSPQPFFLLKDKNNVILVSSFLNFIHGFLNDSSSTQNIFIAKINLNGQLLIFKKDGGTGTVKLSGAFLNTDGSLLLSGAALNLTEFSGYFSENTLFLLKYDPNLDISFLKNIINDHTHYWGGIGSVTADEAGTIYLDAWLYDTVRISNDTFFINSWFDYEYNLQRMKFTSSGNFIEIKYKGSYARSYVGFTPLANYDLELVSFMGNHTNGGMEMIRINKKSSSTNGWIHSYGGNSENGSWMTGYALTSSESRLYYSATYSGNFTLSGNFNLYNSGMYIAKLEHSGQYEYVLPVEFDARPTHLSNISHSGLVVSGTYYGAPNFGGYKVDSTALSCGFIAKIYDLNTGIKENLNLDNLIKIYPNPSEGKFNLLNPSEFLFDYKIYNGIGSLVKIGNGESVNNQLFDLTGFPIGMYFLQINSTGSSITKKLILK